MSQNKPNPFGLEPEDIPKILLLDPEAHMKLLRACAALALRYIRRRPASTLGGWTEEDLAMDLYLFALLKYLPEHPTCTPEELLRAIDREANRLSQRERRARLRIDSIDSNPYPVSSLLQACTTDAGGDELFDLLCQIGWQALRSLSGKAAYEGLIRSTGSGKRPQSRHLKSLRLAIRRIINERCLTEKNRTKLSWLQDLYNRFNDAGGSGDRTMSKFWQAMVDRFDGKSISGTDLPWSDPPTSSPRAKPRSKKTSPPSPPKKPSPKGRRRKKL